MLDRDRGTSRKKKKNKGETEFYRNMSLLQVQVSTNS